MKVADVPMVMVGMLSMAAFATSARLSLSDASLMDPRNYPVTRVVELLKDMVKQLENEQKADEDVYAKLACWCETNDKAKTKAIADAEARLSELGAKVETLAAEGSRLSQEIESLTGEIEKNQKALDQATALRKKQLAEFNAEENEMLAAIQSLGQAITVLQKHHGGAASASFLAGVVAKVNSEMHRHTKIMQGAMTPHQKQMIASLLQQPAGGGYKAYEAQSGEIFGILQQMKANFEENLAASRKEENEAKQAYADLKVAKEEQIEFGKSQVFDKKQRLATVDEDHANSRQDLEDTEASLGADQEFLAGLKEKCSLTDKEWEERQKTRAGELAAVAKAIAVLSGDDAKDLFSRTFNAAASFIQAHSKSHAVIRNSAAVLLDRVAARTGNPKLSALATTVRLDAFTRVKQAIDEMVTQLLKESADEIKHRDSCINDLHDNKADTEAKSHAHANKEQEIEGLKMTIATLSGEITTLQKEVAELQVQKQRATEDRAAEHKEFQGVLADQKETQELLSKARQVLKDFYDQAALLQKHQGPAAPEGFKAYEKQGDAATGVLHLLEQIIADAKELEAETTHAEEQAEKAFQKLVEETDASVASKQEAIVNKGAQKANAEKDLAQAKNDAEGLADDLEALGITAGGLHKSCDYYLTNFDVRQTARTEEVEALRQAKAILSGMKV